MAWVEFTSEIEHIPELDCWEAFIMLKIKAINGRFPKHLTSYKYRLFNQPILPYYFDFDGTYYITSVAKHFNTKWTAQRFIKFQMTDIINTLSNILEGGENKMNIYARQSIKNFVNHLKNLAGLNTQIPHQIVFYEKFINHIKRNPINGIEIFNSLHDLFQYLTSKLSDPKIDIAKYWSEKEFQMETLTLFLPKPKDTEDSIVVFIDLYNYDRSKLRDTIQKLLDGGEK